MNHLSLTFMAWLILIGLFASSSLGEPPETTTRPARIERDPHGITVRVHDGVLRLQVWSDRIVRVTFAMGDKIPEISSLAVNTKPQDVKLSVEEETDTVKLKTRDMQVLVNSADDSLTFTDSKGNAFLVEPPGARSMEPITLQEQATWKIKQTFLLAGHEAVYGLGQHPDGVMNYAGHKPVRLLQQNTMVGVPVLMSSRGYGIFWDNPSVTEVSTAKFATAAASLQWASEVGDSIDYYVMYGPEIDQAIAGYRQLTGAAPMLGRWAFGLWQSKERYSSQDELLWIVEQYRKRGIPLDGIIQDWQYWSPQPWGSHVLDKSRYYDARGMMQQLHRDNIHLLISVWAKFDLGSKNFKELEAAGALFDHVIPYVFPAGQGKWYDPFSEKGREIYWRQISKELFSVGVDGWWLDATEPELSGKWGEFREYKTAAGMGAKVFNAYPLMTTTAVHDGQRSQSSDKRMLILTRSAYAGQQRNAAITWSGDIRGSWDVFAKQIPAGINFCLSGIPYWNTDIGGFFGSDPSKPAYRELFTRWFQFGAFCPMFRIHGTDQPKEIWRFDDATQKILISYDKLRYRLLPYIYSTSWSVTHDGSTMMRGLVMDFRDDAKVFGIADQYLFGPSIMVNPVVHAGATSRSVYLPNGTGWFDFWTGKSFSGGQSIDAAAPIERMPLFVRAGSILPLGPIVQSAMGRPADPIEVRIYPGADGHFTLYEDEGDNYNYESGAYATIAFEWTENSRTLHIGQRQGEFAGLLKDRTFRIVTVGDGVGAGIEAAETVDVETRYSGTQMDIVLPAVRKSP